MLFWMLVFVIAPVVLLVSPMTDPNVRYRAFLANGAARDRNDRLLTTTTANWQTEPTGGRGPNGFFFAWTDSSAPGGGPVAGKPRDHTRIIVARQDVIDRRTEAHEAPA